MKKCTVEGKTYVLNAVKAGPITSVCDGCAAKQPGAGEHLCRQLDNCSNCDTLTENHVWVEVAGMTEDKRQQLIAALTETWLRELERQPAQLADQVAEWLCYGRIGYNDMSDADLLCIVESSWSWEELGLKEENFK